MIYAVLEALRYQRSAKITHIMYKTNMNCLILADLLGSLKTHGYVTVKNYTTRKRIKNKTPSDWHMHRYEYSLTLKGLEFFKSVESTMKALSTLKETCERQRYIIDAENTKISQN